MTNISVELLRMARKPKIERPITSRQKAFAHAWVSLLEKGRENGTEAARIAGYKGNDGVLAVQAHQNLRNPKIKKLIKDLRRDVDRAAATSHLADIMCSAEVLTRVSMLARADLLLVLNEAEELDIAELKRSGLGFLLAGMETVTTTDAKGNVTVRKKFKIEPRSKFLELLGKHHGLWTDEIDDPDELLSQYLGIPKHLLPTSIEPSVTGTRPPLSQFASETPILTKEAPPANDDQLDL